MAASVELLDLGTVDYAEALALQRELFERLITQKESPSAFRPGRLVLCEHPHVYTLGKSGKAENLLVSEEFLRGKGAALHHIERGGDITYHGPGQIVGYPILDLEQVGLGLREYIEAVEQSIIETVAEYGIEAGRIEGKTGVWVYGTNHPVSVPHHSMRMTNHPVSRSGCHPSTGGELPTCPGPDAKICAIGVKASRGVVMHGFALNVATDLKWFEYINPCGFTDGAVTSIEKETGEKVDMNEVKRVLCGRLEQNLQIRIKE